MYAGATTALTSPLGGYSINLAAISAALAAGPAAGDDPDGRWVAGVSTGATCLVLGPLAALVTTVSAAAPAGVIAAVAGLALLGTFGSAAASALSDERLPGGGCGRLRRRGVRGHRRRGGAAFWALLAGGVVALVLRRRQPA